MAQKDIIAARCLLATELAKCERGAFPGSAAWLRENTAGKALQAFDDEHPEALGLVCQAVDDGLI